MCGADSKYAGINISIASNSEIQLWTNVAIYAQHFITSLPFSSSMKVFVAAEFIHSKKMVDVGETRRFQVFPIML